MSAPARDCPSEETLLAFLHGALGRAPLAALDQHLDGCAACRDLVAALVDVAPRPGAAAPAPTAPPSLSAGNLIADRYRIARFIGRGGMGEVYEAEDELLHERVALKALAPDLAGDAEAIRRLKREVLLARRITHPNICRIFDFGMASAPQVFLTMELLSGETLRRRLARGRMRPDAALPLVQQMAAGLAAAHQAGVIHRDFKSDNVLVCPNGPVSVDASGERAVVTDFGLARQSAVGVGLPGGGRRDPTTIAGTVVGTPTHAAPEQLEGRPLTAAADVHALGVVLFEMVTGGLLPFPGRTPLEVAERRLRQDAPSPRRLVPDLVPAWDTVILRCLARDPADRFPTAAAVAAALADGAPAPSRRTRPYGVV